MNDITVWLLYAHYRQKHNYTYLQREPKEKSQCIDVLFFVRDCAQICDFCRKVCILSTQFHNDLNFVLKKKFINELQD